MKKTSPYKKVLSHILYPFFDAFLVVLTYFFCILGTNKIIDLSNYQIFGSLIYVCVVSFLLIIFYFIFGIYSSITENFGIVESLKLLLISLIVQIICFLIAIFIPKVYLPWVSPYVVILGIIVLSFCMCCTRYIFRVYKIIYGLIISNRENYKRTLIIGAGAGCKIVLDETRTNKKNHNKIIAIVDDDSNKIGGFYSNIPVKGPIKDVQTIIHYFNIEEVIIAIADLSEDRLKEIVEYLEPCDVSVKRLPILSEYNSINSKTIFNVDIKELLGRKPAKLDNNTIKNNIKNKVVLVTGAGGSIGSELVRQIYNYEPKQIILFDIYEHGVYDLQQELRHIAKTTGVTIPFETYIGSTYNEFRVEWLFKHFKPDYVYHAAAYKHVPLMEDSPVEAIRTNVIGTYNVAKMADKYKCHKMTLVSTDKAVRPTNVMGATKRFAEIIIQHFACISKNTAYSAVRFGNVLGSSGSVVPLFTKQIAEGGPVTVTHPDIIRFFMTIPEAVGLILQSSMFAKHGEIFILDMGKPVKIITLAEKMIRQAGYVPYKDIKIEFTGLRPGEKLYEEILIDASKHKKTPNSKIYVEDPTIVPSIDDDIKKISEVFVMDSNEEIVAKLRSIITSFQTPEEANLIKNKLKE